MAVTAVATTAVTAAVIAPKSAIAEDAMVIAPIAHHIMVTVMVVGITGMAIIMVVNLAAIKAAVGLIN